MTLTAGTLRYRWRRFLVFDAIASLVWALYIALLGYFGGRAFEHAAWKGLCSRSEWGSRSEASSRSCAGCCASAETDHNRTSVLLGSACSWNGGLPLQLVISTAVACWFGLGG